MGRSPDSLIPSADGQPADEKRDDKPPMSRQGGEANSWAATAVNAVTASSTPPAIRWTQLELFPRRACPLKAKPATDRRIATQATVRRDGVEGGGTRRQDIETTGETCLVQRQQQEVLLVGRRIREDPESAVTKPGRESEAAIVPGNLGRTGRREGPLLPQCVPSRDAYISGQSHSKPSLSSSVRL
jgi:hypothetical protein